MQYSRLGISHEYKKIENEHSNLYKKKLSTSLFTNRAYQA
jgi:hypothetical protein